MKQAIWKQFATRHLLPALGGGKLAAKLAVVQGSDWLLRAIAVESSSFSADRFTLQAFVLPMYVPTRHLYYTYGGRIGSLSGRSEVWWDVKTDGWQEQASRQAAFEAEPFFASTSDPDQLVDYIRVRLADLAARDPRVQEVIAYSLLLSDQTAEASSELERALTTVRALNVKWALDVSGRIAIVKQSIREGPASVRDLFTRWREENERTLNLIS
jgi:hypothetical protein